MRATIGQAGRSRGLLKVDTVAQGQFPRPFEGSYPASLITAIASLVPFIIVSTAYALYRDHIAMQFQQTRMALNIIAGLATGGYAFARWLAEI